MIRSHESDNDDDDKFMHTYIIIIFLLIKLHYSLIHLIDCLFQFIQFYSMLANFIDLAAVSSLTACCTQNCLSTQLSHNMNYTLKDFYTQFYK